MLCCLFHCSCWCILSILRFLYIIHPNWLHQKLPEAKYITVWATAGVLIIFSVCLTIILGTNIYFGWPSKPVYEMPTKHMLLCIMAPLSSYVSLTGTSCILYILILRKRGRFGKKVSPTTEPLKEIPPKQQSLNSGVVTERPSGVNFTNILRTGFTHANPTNAKN